MIDELAQVRGVILRGQPSVLGGVGRILKERLRVIGMGRTTEGDEMHYTDHELERAAAYKLLVVIYGEEKVRQVAPEGLWPWPCVDRGGDCSDPEKLVVEAGQLCAAALDLRARERGEEVDG